MKTTVTTPPVHTSDGTRLGKSLLVLLASLLIGPQLGCVDQNETDSLEGAIYAIEADAGSISTEDEDGGVTIPGDDGGVTIPDEEEEVDVCVLDVDGYYSGDDCLDEKCEGTMVSGEDTCGDLAALPSCEGLRQHNASVEKHAGGKVMEFVPTNVGAFGHYETEYSRKSVSKQVLKVSSTSITAASLVVDRANAANLKLCLSTGTCAVDPLTVASPIGKKVATGLSVAGKAASAITAVLYAYEVARDLNDASCTVIIKKWHKVLEAEAETVLTSACAEDEADEVQCNVCGDTEAQTGSEPVKSLKLAFEGELWKNEDMDKGACNADWVNARKCGGAQGRNGWCMRASCGTGTPVTRWIGWDHAWNILAAYEAARLFACNDWAEEIQDQY